jgi:hypothetical protein
MAPEKSDAEKSFEDGKDQMAYRTRGKMWVQTGAEILAERSKALL